ncbi:MAG: transposase [Spirochaetaceae bacterium]|jgi:REP element-mobilizing transposase RayT|nr:transposase [Spirochaetaceae bacterium]
MRALRILAASVWYFVCTAVNNREPLFWSPLERARFMRVLNEARKRYVFELRGLRFCGPWVSFYIKPADGLMLPEIMQWIKQTYAVRYNVHDGRTGHIWGDRYQSEIVDGPPEDAEEYVFAPVVCKAGRRVRRKRRRGAGSGGGSAADPVMDAKGRPRTWETAQNSGSPPDLPRSTDLSHGFNQPA